MSAWGLVAGWQAVAIGAWLGLGHRTYGWEAFPTWKGVATGHGRRQPHACTERQIANATSTKRSTKHGMRSIRPLHPLAIRRTRPIARKAPVGFDFFAEQAATPTRCVNTFT